MNYFPLLDEIRSNSTDARYFGFAFLYNKNGKIKGVNSNAKFYLRSTLKPIQASVLDDEIIDYYKLTEEELAVGQGSHSGEKIHTDLVRSILEKIKVKEEELLCPIIPPLNTKGITKFSKIHNNCSGKHALMCAYSKFHKLDLKTYNNINHPLQLKIQEKLLSYAKTQDFILTKDGCTVPVWGLKIKDMAECFLNYYKDKNNKKLINAYKKYPYIIGGCDDFGKRSDTKIMELNPKLISKVGAGGFIYVYHEEKEEILIVKMSQNNNKAREIITLEILYNLNWLDKRYYDKNIYTEANEKIGEYKLCHWED